jgi:glycine/D-amino acid oxidase-like deaminating enzyme
MGKYDYIVVGQGIAGTVVAHTLIQQYAKKVLVIGSTQKKCSSLVAGGIFNPLTGKKLVKTWKAHELFPKMLQFYANLEETLQEKFLHITPIYRPFRSIQEQNDWLAKSSLADFKPYLAETTNDQHYQADIYNDLGGLETIQAGWIDLPKLLEVYRCFIREKGFYLEEDFDYDALQITEKVTYRQQEADKIIFCEGMGVVENPYFQGLPLSPVKGETLDIYVPEAHFSGIVNQGVSIVPLGNHLYRVASTYSWSPLDWENTETARQELAEKARNLLKKDFEIVGQKAGVRPATKHRRPIVGRHPNYSCMAIFNGLGSKGVSLAPYWANHLIEHLEYGAPLDKELIQPS